ncbi:MAG: biotin/lipoyl-containing protein [Vicinamibacterales bacterium]
MHYEVEVGGRVRQVSLVRAGAGFAVTVDGHTTHVEAVRIDAHTLSLVWDSVWPKDTVFAADPATGRVTVQVDGAPVSVSLNGRRSQGRGRHDDGAHTGSGPQRVVAPMPGKVIRVLVQAGDAVRSRQPLLVVEAMKMENELRAGRDGVVTEIHAREGQSVDAGALLIVIQ